MAITVASFSQEITAGRKVEAADIGTDNVPAEYREALINLMTQQADSELAGGYGYIPWIEKAPDIHEKLLVAQIVKDEIRHAYAIFKLLSELGIDVDRRIAQMDYNMRLESEPDIGTARKSDDKRVNIFYYPIDTWTDFIMFNFCMDRGAGHQLEDALESSYAPWARTIRQIFQEEVMHMNHGNTWIKRLALDPETHDECQQALNKWYVRTMNIFGRPNSTKNQVYQQFGLKKRDNEEVRQAYKADIEENIKGLDLTLPEWIPNYDESV